MYEVEAKVPLSKADFERLKKEVRKIAKLKGKSVKKDHYFGDTSEYLFRLRDKNGKGILNLKSKKGGGGSRSESGNGASSHIGSENERAFKEA